MSFYRTCNFLIFISLAVILNLVNFSDSQEVEETKNTLSLPSKSATFLFKRDVPSIGWLKDVQDMIVFTDLDEEGVEEVRSYLKTAQLNPFEETTYCNSTFGISKRRYKKIKKRLIKKFKLKKAVQEELECEERVMDCGLTQFLQYKKFEKHPTKALLILGRIGIRPFSDKLFDFAFSIYRLYFQFATPEEKDIAVHSFGFWWGRTARKWSTYDQAGGEWTEKEKKQKPIIEYMKDKTIRKFVQSCYVAKPTKVDDDGASFEKALDDLQVKNYDELNE